MLFQLFGLVLFSAHVYGSFAAAGACLAGTDICLASPCTKSGGTLMLVYHYHKPVFTPKMAIFRRAGIREGGLPLPLAFQYLILLI